MNILSLSHHDIRCGMTVRIPRHLTHSSKASIEQALVSSSNERGFIPIAGTELSVFGCLKRITDGNAYLFVAANPREETENLEVGTILYSAVVSCRLSTAPLTWRHLALGYLESLLCAPPFQSFSSLPMMPRELPWVCGFSLNGARHLNAAQAEAVSITARLAALYLYSKCEEGAVKMERVGKFPEPDETLYPELQLWNDGPCENK